MRRRHFLSAALSIPPLGFVNASAADEHPSFGFRHIDLKLPGPPDLAQRAVVLVPQSCPTEKLPAVVLLHGYAQGLKESSALRAWPRDYAVTRAHARLVAPPIKRIYETVRFLSDTRIRELNFELRKKPFAGLILICPVTPIPYFKKKSGPIFDTYSDWIEQTLLPAVRERAPLLKGAKHLGLAGVSMGGHVGLELLIRKPKLFSAFSGIQIAITARAARVYARRLARVFQETEQKPIHILTSSRDQYRLANRTLHQALLDKGVTSRFQKPFGTHTSSWMREIGSLEMLLWQERNLRPR